MELKCKLSPGKIWRSPDPDDGKWTKDQLADAEVWIHPRSWTKYLRDTYGITEQEYYNIIIYGDKDYRPKCYCGNSLIFNGIYKGYSSYCCRECYNSSEELSTRMSKMVLEKNNDAEWYEANRIRQSKRLTELWKDPNYRKLMSSVSKSSWSDITNKTNRINKMKESWTDDRKKLTSDTQSRIMLERWSDPESRARLTNPDSVLARELSRSDHPESEPWYFYIAKSDQYPEWFKVGITANIKGRMMYNYDKAIAILTTLLIAGTIESEIKKFIIANKLNNKDDISSEWFTKDNSKQVYRKLMQLITDYKLDRNTFMVIRTK